MPRPQPKKTPVHVVRQWSSSPVIYGFDSRHDRRENPDHHPTIGLTHRGKFVDEVGRELDPKKVPAYILAEAKKTNLDIAYRPPNQRTLATADAMLAAGVEDTEPDPNVRARRRKITRAVFA